MINTFPIIFLLALSLMVLLRLWLAWRHVAHILAHRATVPGQFAGRIELRPTRKRQTTAWPGRVSAYWHWRLK